MSDTMSSRTGRAGARYLPREQRLNRICDAMQRRWYDESADDGEPQWYTVHGIARMIGMRPSHHLRGLLGTLCAEGWLEKRGGVGRGCCKIRREYRSAWPSSQLPF
jgi:hypothetical protein